jgi:hypothetical protein
MSKEAMNNLLDNYLAKTKKDQKDIPKKDVKTKKVSMKVAKFTPNGEVGLHFNQKVNVPFDFDENKNTTGRLLGEGGISLS